MISSCLRSASLLAAALLLTFSAFGQTGTGSVNGTITDASGSAVPNATVKLTNAATRIVDQAQSNSAGYFVFINVRPGGYTLSVESQGFKKAQIPEFNLDVNQTMTQNLALELGSIND